MIGYIESYLKPKANYKSVFISQIRAPTRFQVPVLEEFNGIQTLIGRVKIIEDFTTDNNNVLARNLTLSREIIEFVGKRVIFSDTYPNRQSFGFIINNFWITTFYQLRCYVREVPGTKSLNRVETTKAGNCYEMANLGLLYPSGSVNVELFELKDPCDHIFLVVGRDPKTNPENPSEWNPETVICDPWAQAYYPASRYTEFLMNYKGLVEVDGGYRTWVDPLCPGRDIVGLYPYLLSQDP